MRTRVPCLSRAAGLVAVIVLTSSTAAVASAPEPSELPEVFRGSYNGTIATTAQYASDGTLVRSADTITLQVANAVFERGTGSTEYTLVAGTGTIADPGAQTPSTTFGCPCTETVMLDPANPQGPKGFLLGGQFTVTPMTGSDSWDGASAFDVAASIPGIERDVTQTGTTEVGDTLDIGPLTGEGDTIETEPIKLRVNPDGDYSLQFDTTVHDPPPAGGTGGAETETDSGLLIGTPAGGEGAPRLSAPAVAGGSLKLSFALSAPGTVTFTLQHRLGPRWVSAKTVSRAAEKGRNTLPLRGLFGAAALKRAGAYRLLLKASSKGRVSPQHILSFTVR